MTKEYLVGMRWLRLTLELKPSRALCGKGDRAFSPWVGPIRNVRTEWLLIWEDPEPGLHSYERNQRWILTDYLNVLRNADTPVAGEV
jgi:hypothetical protein